MHRISSQTEAEIIELWFKAYPRDRIARTAHVSGSTVSNLIASLPQCLDELRRLSVELRKTNSSPAKALKGAKLSSKLGDLGVDLDQLETFLRTTKKLSKDTEYKPEKVVKAAMALSELEKNSGKTYAETLKEFKEKTEQTRELKEQTVQLQREKENAEINLNQTLKRKKATLKDLKNFNMVKTELKRYGISLKKPEQLRDYLRNMKETGGNPKNFLKFTRKSGSIKGSLTLLTKKVEQKASELHEITEETKTCKQTLSNTRNALAETQEEIRKENLNLKLLKEQRSEQKARLDQEKKNLADFLGAKAEVKEIVNAVKANEQKLAKLNYDIELAESNLGKIQSETITLEDKKRGLEREIEERLRINDYSTQCLQAIKSLEERKTLLEKKVAQRQSRIALGDTVFNFLVRKTSNDFDSFFNMVESVKKAREGKTYLIPALVPRIEETIRLEALKCFEGDLVSKAAYKALWDGKERLRREKNCLQDKVSEVETQLKRERTESADTKRENSMLKAIKVYVEGQPRTIRDLEEHIFNRIDDEIEQRANKKFDSTAARTYGLINWLADRSRKNDSGA